MPDPYSSGSREFTSVLGQLQQLQMQLEQVRTRLAAEHERELSMLRSSLGCAQRGRRSPVRLPFSLQEPAEGAGETGSPRLRFPETGNEQLPPRASSVDKAAPEIAGDHAQESAQLRTSREASQRARAISGSSSDAPNPSGTGSAQSELFQSGGRLSGTGSAQSKLFREGTALEERVRRVSQHLDEEIARRNLNGGPEASDAILIQEGAIVKDVLERAEEALFQESLQKQAVTSIETPGARSSMAMIGPTSSSLSKVCFECEDGSEASSRRGSDISNMSNDANDADEACEVLPVPLREVWYLTDEEVTRGLLAFKISARASAGGTGSEYSGREISKVQSQLKKSKAIRSQAWLLPYVRGNMVLHPQSNRRLCWDLGGLLLISYDLLMVPMQFFEIEESAILQIANWTVCIYWTIDIVFSLRTGVYVDGELVMAPMVILRHYAKTWMFLDIAIVAVEWVTNTVHVGAEGLADAGSVFRFLRLMRFLRLIRMVKAERLVEELEVRLNSNSVLLCLGIVKSIAYLVMINHLLACFWYGIGDLSDGWVYAEVGGTEVGKFQEKSIPYQYFTSLHWSLAQFHSSMEVNPTNIFERMYASFVVMLALVLFSSFLSSITNMMMDLHSLRQDLLRLQRVLRNYLAEHHISRSLSAKVKKYIEAQRKGLRGDRNDENSLRRALPENLMTDLLCEARIPILVNHGLFWDMNKVYPRTSRQIAKQAITASTFAPGEMVFTHGDAGERMIFIEVGKLVYRYGVSTGNRHSKVSISSTNLDPGMQILSHTDWVGEAAVWMVWEYKGELTSIHGSEVLELSVDEFAEAVKVHSGVLLEMSRYAHQFKLFLATREPSDIMEVPPHVHWELGAPFRGSMFSLGSDNLSPMYANPSFGRGQGHLPSNANGRSLEDGPGAAHVLSLNSSIVRFGQTSSKDGSGLPTSSFSRHTDQEPLTRKDAYEPRFSTESSSSANVLEVGVETLRTAGSPQEEDN